MEDVESHETRHEGFLQRIANHGSIDIRWRYCKHDEGFRRIFLARSIRESRREIDDRVNRGITPLAMPHSRHREGGKRGEPRRKEALLQRTIIFRT